MESDKSMDYVFAYDDEFDSKTELVDYYNAICRGTGFNEVTGATGIAVEQRSDPEQLIAEVEQRERRPVLVVLDIASQASSRHVNGEVNGGFAVARAVVKKWPGVPLIFLTSFVTDGFRKFTAGGFEGYEDFIGKGDPWSCASLEQSVRRVCGGTHMLRSRRLTIDPQRNELRWEGKLVSTITMKEWRMADTITQTYLSRKTMATSSQILMALRNGSDDPESLHPAMSRLKLKISMVAGYTIGPNDLFRAVKGDAHEGKEAGYLLVER